MACKSGGKQGARSEGWGHRLVQAPPPSPVLAPRSDPARALPHSAPDTGPGRPSDPRAPRPLAALCPGGPAPRSRGGSWRHLKEGTRDVPYLTPSEPSLPSSPQGVALRLGSPCSSTGQKTPELTGALGTGVGRWVVELLAGAGNVLKLRDSGCCGVWIRGSRFLESRGFAWAIYPAPQ